MLLRNVLRLLQVIVLMAGVANAAEAPRGSPLRSQILDTLRPRVEADIGQAAKFKVHEFNVEGNWAYLALTPMLASGSPVDWTQTRYAQAMEDGTMTDMVLVLLRKKGQGWGIAEYSFGPVDSTWEDWAPKYHLARGFFLGDDDDAPQADSSDGALVANEPVTAKPPTTKTKPEEQDQGPTPEALKKDAAHKSYLAALVSLAEYEKTDDQALWQKGIEYAEKATVLDPERASYWRTLGFAYAVVAGQDVLASTLAENALGKAIERDAKDASSRLLLARLQLQRSAFASALDQLEAALVLKPELAQSVLIADMCRAYLADDLSARGEAFFESQLSASPGSVPLRLGKAILLGERLQFAEAIPLAQAIVDDPKATQEDAAKARELVTAWKAVSK